MTLGVWGVALALAVPVFGQAAPVEDDAPARDPDGRRAQSDEPTVLAFKSVKVEDIIPFIVEATGKVVLPQQDVMSRVITVLNDEPIPRSQALDMVVLALQQNGIGVVETPKLILLRDLAEIDRQDVPVLGPDESVLDRTDLGTIVEKVYALSHGTAENLGEILEDAVPDYATVSVDEESNQVVVRGNIGLLQRIERLVDALDRPGTAALSSATFRLRYADAEQIAEAIEALFGEESNGRSSGGGNERNQFFQRFGRGGGQEQATSSSDGGRSVLTSENLRVSANTQQNSVTVVAEDPIIDAIREQIETAWDQPLPDEAVVPRIYDLQNSDPIKVRDLLEGLFGQGTPSGQGQGQGASSAQGVGRLAGQFSFEAIPEAGRLVVVAKSPDNLAVIDKIVEDLDKPQSVGLPRVIELKHASAEDLSEQLNALLALEGTLAQVNRSETGLSDGGTGSSPFAEDASDDGANDDATDPGTISFWWQRARVPTDSAGSGALVGKIRIVPVARQNAVMVMAPAEYMESVSQLVQDLDKPGRQVLISAVIAEIEVEDATALGIRWSNAAITPNRPDNAIAIGGDFDASRQVLGGLFDTSVLNVDTDINVLLQALNEMTEVRIMSEPRIFTSDNQEAEFFDGQDIPFITDSQVTDNGNQIQSFDYRAVGINLRVRPRITVRRDVDLRINLELSSIQPEATQLGGFIVDRRETTTQLIVADGQTVVISGILRNEASEIERKVPFFGDLPLLGGLFRSWENVIGTTELVAFITPIVITNEEELDELNEPFRERLGTLERDIRVQQEEAGVTLPENDGEEAEQGEQP